MDKTALDTSTCKGTELGLMRARFSDRTKVI